MGEHREEQKKMLGRIYFSTGVFFLFFLALVWSLDPAFVYFSLGGAAFFLYLWYRNLPKEKDRESSYQQKSRKPPTYFHSDFSRAEFFSTWRKRGADQPSRKPLSLGRLIVVVIWIVFGFLMWLFLFSGWEDDFPEEARYQYDRGQNFYYTGQYDSALLSYRKAIAVSPEYVDALAGYGNMLSAKGQRDSAIIIFDQALAIDPEHEIAQYYKTWLYYSSQDYSRALEIITPLVDQNPAYYDAVELKASVLYGLQRYDEALPLFEIAYNAGNRSQWLCHVMAYLFDLKENTGRAIELYKEALTYDPYILTIHQRLGELMPGADGDAYRTEAARLQLSNDKN
ncbi:MAG: tetratricopeptide repeat protein [Cyclobacteriaceae bacterium]|nr:tetratricopeptide repeat protein [Cyclobacteriaceae bacterium]